MSVLASTMAAALLMVLVATTSVWAQDKGTLRFAYLRLGWGATEIIHQEKLLENRGDSVATILTQLRIAR